MPQRYNIDITFQTWSEEDRELGETNEHGFAHELTDLPWDEVVSTFNNGDWDWNELYRGGDEPVLHRNTEGSDRDYFENGRTTYYDAFITHQDGSPLTAEELERLGHEAQIHGPVPRTANIKETKPMPRFIQHRGHRYERVRRAGLESWPEYHHCENLLDCCMQEVYYMGLESEGQEIEYSMQSALEYIPKNTPNRKRAARYLQENFGELFDEAFAEVHDQVRSEVEAMVASWTKRAQQGVQAFAQKRGIDAAALWQDVSSDLTSLYLDESGAGSGTWDRDTGPWAELLEEGVTGDDILARMPGMKLSDELMDAMFTVVYAAGSKAAELANADEY